jgi:hypothetical protein
VEILQRDFQSTNFTEIEDFNLSSISKDYNLNGREFYSVECKCIINNRHYVIYSFALFEENNYYVLTFYCPGDVHKNKIEEFKAIGSSLKFIIGNKKS